MGRVLVIATLVTFVTALGAPVDVTAAVAYRISLEPAAPRVSENVTVTVATLFPASGGGPATEPQPLDSFPWTFVAESPAGESHEIGLERRGPNEWSGTFTFYEPGRWEVGLDRRHLGTPVDPSLGARVTIDVQRPGVLLPPLALPLIGIVVTLLAGVALMVRRRR